MLREEVSRGRSIFQEYEQSEGLTAHLMLRPSLLESLV